MFLEKGGAVASLFLGFLSRKNPIIRFPKQINVRDHCVRIAHLVITLCLTHSTTPMNRVRQIHELGQSVWLDFIDRQLMNTGALQTLIQEDDTRGLTSNPAIFEKAISSSQDYDEDDPTFYTGRSRKSIHWSGSVKPRMASNYWICWTLGVNS